MTKLRLIAAMWMSAIAPAAQAAGISYRVDDTGIPDPGSCQVEAWVSVDDRGGASLTAAPACAFAALPGMEVGLSLERVETNGDRRTLVGVAMKAPVVVADHWSLAIAAGIGHDGKAMHGATAALLVTAEPGPRWRLNLNAGPEWDSSGRRVRAFWGVGVERDLAAPLTLIAETYGQLGRGASVQAGVRLTTWGERFDLDLVGGTDLSRSGARWLTVGGALRF